MYLYVIYIFLSLFAVLEISLGKKHTRKILFAPFILFFLLASLRWERGTDWQSYKNLFDFVDDPGFLLVFEPGFYYLNYVVKSFTEDYSAMLLIQALFIYTINYHLIKKYSISPFVSVLVWFGFYMGSVFFVRFNIAVTITAFSFLFIVDRKWWKFLSCIILAMLFHRSAILFIPAYFLYNRFFSKRQIIFILLASFFLSFVFERSLGTLADADLGIFSDKSAAYLEAGSDDVFGAQKSPLLIMLTGASYRVMIILLVVGLYYELYKMNSTFRGLFNLYLAGICLFIIVVPISIPMARMSQYYEYLQLFFIPYLILHFRISHQRNIALLLVTFFYLSRLFSNINSYEDLFVPYKSIFNKDLPVKIG